LTFYYLTLILLKGYIMNRIIQLILLLAILLMNCAGPKKAVSRQDDVYGSRAYRYFLDGDMRRAIETYRSGFAAARKIDNGIGAARCLSNIGRAYYELGQSDSAALYFAKAREEFVIFADGNEASRSAAFLALCFASAGDEGQARKWFSTALESGNKYIGNDKRKRRESDHYHSVIKTMIDFRLTSKVNDENALDAALTFYTKKKDHSFLSTIYSLKADIEYSKNNCSAAIRYLNDALSSIETSNEKYKRSKTLLRMSTISFCAGDEKAGKHYYERALDCSPRGVAVPAVEEVSSCNNGRCR